MIRAYFCQLYGTVLTHLDRFNQVLGFIFTGFEVYTVTELGLKHLNEQEKGWNCISRWDLPSRQIEK